MKGLLFGPGMAECQVPYLEAHTAVTGKIFLSLASGSVHPILFLPTIHRQDLVLFNLITFFFLLQVARPLLEPGCSVAYLRPAGQSQCAVPVL
jgi:hypothetical protein